MSGEPRRFPVDAFFAGKNRVGAYFRLSLSRKWPEMPTIDNRGQPEDAMTLQTEEIRPDTPLYNSRTVLGIMRFIKQRHSYVDPDEVLSYAGIAESQVNDENHWFTQEQVNRCHEKLVEITGNGNIDREAGRFMASAECLGPIKGYVASFLTPGKLCEYLRRGNSHFSKSCSFEAKEKGAGRVEITVRWKPGVQEQPFQCENRKGVIEGAWSLLGSGFPSLEEKECLFHGGECCRYEVKWRQFRSTAWRKVRNCLFLPFVGINALLLFTAGHEVLFVSLALWLAALLGLSIKASVVERHELTGVIEAQKSLTDNLLQRKEGSDNNARMTQEIGHILMKQNSVADMLSEVTVILEKRLDYDRGIILIADKEKDVLEAKQMFGYSEEETRKLSKGVLRLDERDVTTVRCFLERKPLLVNNMDQTPDSADRYMNIAKRLGAKSFLCCPIVSAEEAIGVLLVENKIMKRMLLQSDMDLLTLVGQVLGVNMQNYALKQTEKALRESEALFRAVVEKSNEVLLLSNAAGKVSYVSPPVAEGFGYAPAELIGADARELVCREDSRSLAEAVLWVRQNPGKPKNATVRARRKDGSVRWVEMTMRNLFLEPGVRAIVTNLQDVTDRKQAVDALEESESKFRDLVEKAVVGVYLTQDRLFKYVNSKFCEIHGYADPGQMQGLRVSQTILPEDLPLVRRTNEWASGADYGAQQFRIVRKDGQTRHVEVYGKRTIYRGKPAVIGMIIDVTDRKNAEDALLWKTTFLEALVDSSHDGILVLDNRTESMVHNKRLVELWGEALPEIEPADIEGRINFLMAPIKKPEEFYQRVVDLHHRPDEEIRTEFELKNGKAIEASSYPVLGKNDGERYGRIWMFRDVTQIRHYWTMLEKLSATDGLTGIANRRRFDEFLEREWRRSMRDFSELSLLIVDIDYFKQFNDRYGHLMGDDCLKQVAAALERTVKRAGDLVARYGGEEFGCILPGTGEEEALEVAQRILDAIATLNVAHEASAAAGHLTVSIGAATQVREKGRGWLDLIRRADQSLYAAKQRGRNRVVALWDDSAKGTVGLRETSVVGKGSGCVRASTGSADLVVGAPIASRRGR